MSLTKRKTVIVGAGLGGLVHGIMLKKARPDEEVVIYDSNKKPGGFCFLERQSPPVRLFGFNLYDPSSV